MSEKVKAIRGSKERAEEVVKWLIRNGATNDICRQITGGLEDSLYCVVPDGSVDILSLRFEYLFDVEELPRWRALAWHTYYYVTDDGDILNDEEKFTILDAKRYEFGNYFQTEEEAEEYLNKIIKLLKRDE